MFSQKIVKQTLKQLRRSQISADEAFRKLQDLPYESLGYARLDHHRRLRKGLVEAVFSPGKTVPQLIQISQRLMRAGSPLIVTRLDKGKFKELSKAVPKLNYDELARLAYFSPNSARAKSNFKILIVTAGTSDIPVAEEARLTLEVMGESAETLYDCGVAGIHRLLDHLEKIRKAQAIICIAGMDGALPSVIAGLSRNPVIAVPTSVGYGASFKGLSALLNMLNSCAQGIACVNIDNGFGAACFAYLMLNQDNGRGKR